MVKNKKKLIILVVASFLVVIIVGAVIAVSCLSRTTDDKVKSAKDGDITRFEWTEMLCEKVGMTEFNNGKPYFEDVKADNDYFSYIQSAVEWEILDTDKSSEFDGNSPVSGRFIALTAMKSVGEEKIKIYLDSENEVSDNTYIRLAIDNNLIDEEQLSQGFTKEECRQVLETFESLYFGEFCKDDYSQVKYKDDVTELSSDDILSSNDNGLEIAVKQDVADTLKVNSIIIFEQDNTKLKIARKVNSIGSGGIIKLSEVNLDEVIENLAASDITELKFEDIVNYYGLSDNEAATSNMSYRAANENIIRASSYSAKSESKGFKISLSAEAEDDENDLVIEVTNNDNNKAYQLPTEYKLDNEAEINAEIDIDKIDIEAQAEYSFSEGVKYAEVALDAHSTFTGKIAGFEDEEKFLLCETSVPLGNGLMGVDIQLYLVISVDGAISFQLELPARASVRYEKDKGFRNFEHEISAENPTLEVNCEVAEKLRFEPILVILDCLNVIDAEADIGVTASANTTAHPSQVCTDVNVAFPVMTISVCADEDADSIIGVLGLSAEWEIISSDDAPFKFGLHFEELSDGTTQFVDECTYRENEETVPKETAPKETAAEETPQINESDNTYTTRFMEVNAVTYPNFIFNYSSNWTVTQEDVTQTNETVVLSNDRGVTVTYTHIGGVAEGSLGGGSTVSMSRVEVSEIGDSQFTPAYVQGTDHSDLGEFMVAKLKETGVLNMKTDSDFTDIDGNVSYAVLPKSRIGTDDSVRLPYNTEFAFWYSGYISFIAQSPDGQFSEDEEKEVIAILNSFRTES